MYNVMCFSHAQNHANKNMHKFVMMGLTKTYTVKKMNLYRANLGIDHDRRDALKLSLIFIYTHKLHHSD